MRQVLSVTLLTIASMLAIPTILLMAAALWLDTRDDQWNELDRLERWLLEDNGYPPYPPPR